MSHCKNNPLTGQPECHVTSHPNYPELEFCASCKKQFGQPFTWEPLIGLFFTLLIIFITIDAFNEAQTNRNNSSPDTSSQIK